MLQVIWMRPTLCGTKNAVDITSFSVKILLYFTTIAIIYWRMTILVHFSIKKCCLALIAESYGFSKQHEIPSLQK